VSSNTALGRPKVVAIPAYHHTYHPNLRLRTLEGNCREYYGCEAGTNYLSHDGTGRGRIWNEGPNGKRNTNGYLYP
jgi:hypothetical protein